MQPDATLPAAAAPACGAPTIGASVDAIDTPALVIDLDALERNIARMAAWTQARGLRLRPHAKTHKCATIARMQMAAGAVGVCVQKLSEAEALAAAGVTDLYISNEIVDPAKLQRVAVLAGRVRLAIAIDSTLGAERLAAALRSAGTTLDVFVEVDVGHGRCGVAPSAAAALAGLVATLGLRLAGLQAYHGRAQHLRSAAERSSAIAAAVRHVREVQRDMATAGLDCPLVTGAGTGTFGLEGASGVYGELQAGSYVFMDADYALNEPAADLPRFEHALFVKSQVMSRSAEQAVIDAGHKAHAIDAGPPRVWLPAPSGAVGGSFGQGSAEAGEAGAGRFSRLAYVNGGDEHGLLRGPLRSEAPVGTGRSPAQEAADAADAAPGLAAHHAAAAGARTPAASRGASTDAARPDEAASAAAGHGDSANADAAFAEELPALGATVWLVPGHCDPTVNLHDACIGVRGGLARGVVEAIWPIEARGCLR